MTTNPYLNDDDDADLFEEAVSDEEKKRYVIRGPNGEELPDDVQEHLSPYIDSYMDGSGGQVMSSIPSEFLAVGELFSFFSRFSYYKEDGSILLAVAEILDEMTDGKVTKLYEFHDAERRILYTHVIKKLVNFILDTVNPEDTRSHWNEVIIYFHSLAKLTDFILDTATTKYLALAGELGKDVDQQFLDGGIRKERTEFYKVAFGHPAAERDVP